MSVVHSLFGVHKQIFLSFCVTCWLTHGWRNGLQVLCLDKHSGKLNLFGKNEFGKWPENSSNFSPTKNIRVIMKECAENGLSDFLKKQ